MQIILPGYTKTALIDPPGVNGCGGEEEIEKVISDHYFPVKYLGTTTMIANPIYQVEGCDIFLMKYGDRFIVYGSAEEMSQGIAREIIPVFCRTREIYDTCSDILDYTYEQLSKIIEAIKAGHHSCSYNLAGPEGYQRYERCYGQDSL